MRSLRGHSERFAAAAAIARLAGCLALALLLALGIMPAMPLVLATSGSFDSLAFAAEDGESGDGQGTAPDGEQPEGDSAVESGESQPSSDAGDSNSPESPVDPGTSDDAGSRGDTGEIDDPGDSSGSVDAGGGEDQGQDEPVDPVQPEKYFAETLLLKWDEPDDAGVTHFVGDSPIVEKAYKRISITEFGKTVQLNGWYLSTDGTGVAYQTADSTTAIGSFNLRWESSDESIATVAPDGLVSPHGKNGEVVITATVDDENVYQGTAPAATVTIVFDGQEGKYVSKVEILDEDGKDIGESAGGVTVFNDQNAFFQLHARVTWKDVQTGAETVEQTGTGESYDAKAVGTTVTWNVSTSTAFSINADTGRLRTTQYSGNAYVTCSVVGGLGGAVVQDTANVQLDTGVYEYNPADSLTLRVVWEERPDEVVKEQTFSLDELSGRLKSQRVNATVVNNSRFGVIAAEGYLFKDVVALVAVDDADVLQYRFGTADGYDNPVSYRYLFKSGNRYYFPNYVLGGSRAGGQVVPPLLAYRSTLMWNESDANPTWDLDEGTRFRLVFGCLASGDANTSFQIYYIHTITIVLAGGPSAGGGGGGAKAGDSKKSDDDPKKESKKKGNGKGGKGKGKGNGSGNGNGSGTHGSGNAAAARGSGNSPLPSGPGQGAGSAEAALDAEDGESGGDDAASAEEESDASEDPEDAGAQGADIDSAKNWRVYQMMNKNNSDVPDWDDENPISPFAMPVALGTFAIGAGATGIGFRRRLR